MKSPFINDSQLSGKGDKFRGKLVIASNREPYSHQITGRSLKLEVPVGGLVSALETVLRVVGGTWVAWGSGNGDREGADTNGRLWVPPADPAYTLRRVWLSTEAVENYYHGFCNMVLWPLFHGQSDRIVSETAFWDKYERTNRVFAEVILEEAANDSIVWIQDYHLCLVPRLLRAMDPERTIAHFWHIPWPCQQMFSHAPHDREIIAGLLGNDLIGFQIPLYAMNFMECAASSLGAAIDYDSMTVTWQGHVTQVRAFPISIDFRRFDVIAESSSAAAKAEKIKKRYHLPRLVGLAVDRLDYTKGILQRLQALELFFRINRSFRGTFTFIQIAVTSRSGEPFLRYRREVEEMIDGINARFGTAEWKPIIYLRDKLEQSDLIAYYLLADVAVITPLSDGMNLVAKEYVASRVNEDGVLILGRKTGAAAELVESILVDPCDIGAFADSILRALTMPRQEKKKRMAKLRERVRRNTIYHWVGEILDELALLPVTKRGGKHALLHGEDILGRLGGRELFLCLDFDGTLSPIVERPEDAEMPNEIRKILSVLKKRHVIAVISGRSLEDIRSRVGLPGLLYCGNHGYEMEKAEPCASGRVLLEEFLAAVRQAFASLPGVQVEDKGLTASIHFRRLDPVLQKEFLSSFQEIARKFAGKVSVTEGRKVFEVWPPGAVGKGNAVRKLMEGVGNGKLPVCMGDDTSDEDVFKAIRGVGISIAVGGSTAADYYLRTQAEVYEFLKLLARIPHPLGNTQVTKFRQNCPRMRKQKW